MITAGIDVGSTTTKAVFLKGDTILGQIIIPSGSLPVQSARDVFEQCCADRVCTVIDVGGQDTKVITLKDDGDVEDFPMNDKCAAGTGRFLEMLTRKLELDYEGFIDAALDSKQMIHMNSTCAVFAESEVVSLLARGVDKTDIAAAAHTAISERIGAAVRRLDAREIISFAGGGACDRALAEAIEKNLNKKLHIPDSPQTIVALGAAIVIRDKLRRKQRE